MLDRLTAIDIAYDWHSVMNWDDPGVQLYAFSSTGCVQSEEHRQKCLAWLRDECLGKTETEDDEDDLLDLIEYLEQAPIEAP